MMRREMSLLRGLVGVWMLVLSISLILGIFPGRAMAQDTMTPQPVDEAKPAEAAEAEVTVEATAETAQQPTVVGWLELSGELRDGPIPFSFVDPGDVEPGLADVLNQLRAVAEQDKYLGVVLYFDMPELTLTQAEAIGKAIDAAKAKGRKVLAFAEAYNMMDYLVACHCDLILLQHKGGVELHGLAVEEMYLAGLLEKIGVKADMVQVGKYKGADETMTRTEPSQWWSQNFDALLDDLYDQLLTAIAEGRGMTRQEATTLLGEAWALGDTELMRRRVVDRLTDRDMLDVTEIEFGDEFTWDDSMGFASVNTRPTNPFALFQSLFAETSQKIMRPTIMVIHGYGPIHSGESSTGDGLFSDDSIGARTLVRLLGEARDDENVKGVVIRLDSPGGSALASEMIWQAVREVEEEGKPVYASVDGMAASGGYYIVCAADEIYVSDRAILGSIGVVGGKLVLGGLYDWAGVKVHRRTRGPGADLFNSVEPFNEEQRAQVRSAMELVYDQFIDRVMRGRGSRLPDVSKVAEGRLFTGRTAVANGMADKVGGLRETVAAMAGELGLKDGAYDVLHTPRPLSLQEFIGQVLGVQVKSPARVAAVDGEAGAAISAARRLMGPAAWRNVSRTLEGLMLLQDERTLLLMPNAVVVR